MTPDIEYFRESTLIRTLRQPNAVNVQRRKALDFEDNQYVKSRVDVHDQILWYSNTYENASVIHEDESESENNEASLDEKLD